ncbi:MAG TPA: hypothetical protein VF156_04450 [Agromyces sp.]
MHSEHDSTPHAHDRDASEAPRPLGFWLKTVDRLVSREFAAAFDDLDVTRREWRLLNLIAGDVPDERLTAKLAARPHLVASLVDRGWVAEHDGAWRVTDDGRAALSSLGEHVNRIRSRVADAVPAEDYATTLATLEAIARELGWDEEAERAERPHRHFGHGPRGRRYRTHGAEHGRFGGGRPGDEVHVHVHVHGGHRGRGDCVHGAR